MGADATWRCPHIHFYVTKDSFKSLVTQLYFEGGEKNEIDQHRRNECTISLHKKEVNGVTFSEGFFQIVLPPKKNNKNKKK